jgi:hypothetical protein
MTMITSTLVLVHTGINPKPPASLERKMDASSAPEAVAIIQTGGTAVLHGSPADAIDVLALLGCDRQWASACVHYATTRCPEPAVKATEQNGTTASELQCSAYQRYIAWMRLTDNGRRTRDQMTSLDRQEYDSLGIRQLFSLPEPMTEEQRSEAKRLYVEACKKEDNDRSKE